MLYIAGIARPAYGGQIKGVYCMKNWKHGIVAVITAILFVSLSCASSPKVSGLVGLDDALDAAVADLESKLPKGSTIVVSAIDAYHEDIGNFIADDLSARFSGLVTLAREAALQAVEAEQSFQMTGLVSDESMVGIGHFLGANSIISGQIRRYDSFTQLRIRTVDVETSRAIIYSVRIQNNDPILANIMAPFRTMPVVRVRENALEHLNRANDFRAESRFNEAIQELDRAIAIDRNFAEAYKIRAILNLFGTPPHYDRAIADFNQFIRLEPNNPEAINWRGTAYYNQKNYTRAIADHTQAIQMDPANAYFYERRGIAYNAMNNSDRAIEDFTRAIQLEPDNSIFYAWRGNAYYKKEDYERAVADYNEILRLLINRGGDGDEMALYIVQEKFVGALVNRAEYFYGIDNYGEAGLHFEQAISILHPDGADRFNEFAIDLAENGDIDPALIIWTAITQVYPDYAPARNNLERARQQRR